MTNTLITNQNLSDSISSTKSKSSHSHSIDARDPAYADNLVKLCLNKPKLWNWELTTSQSSPNISFPKIQLYNKKGELLAEVDQPNCILRNDDPERFPQTNENETHDDGVDIERPLKIEHSRSKSLQDHQKAKRQQQQLYEFEQASAPNLSELNRSNSKRLTKCDETNEFLNGFIDQLKTSGIECKVRRKRSNSMEVQTTEKKVDELPIIVYSEKGVKVRDFNAKEFDGLRQKASPSPARSLNLNDRQPSAGLAKSKSATDVTKTKKFRRKSSSNSSHRSTSILQRISENRSIASSSDEHETGKEEPRYVLRSSRAGTLLVREESLPQSSRLRRRPKSLGRLNEPISDIETSDIETTDNKKVTSESHYEQEIANIEKLIKTLLTAKPQPTGQTTSSSFSDETAAAFRRYQRISNADSNNNQMNVYGERHEDADDDNDDVDDDENEDEYEKFANKYPPASQRQHQHKHKNSISNIIKNKLNESDFNCCSTSSIPTHSTNDGNNEMNINDDSDNRAIEKSTTDYGNQIEMKMTKRKKMARHPQTTQRLLSNNANEYHHKSSSNNNNDSKTAASNCATTSGGVNDVDGNDVCVKKKFPQNGSECCGKSENSGKSEKRNRRWWCHRRSASADSGSDAAFTCDHEREPYRWVKYDNVDSTIDVRRSRSRRRRKDRSENERQDDTQNGDQTIAIKSLTLPNIEQKPAHLINNASEEVILKLVQQLATLQQQQQKHQQHQNQHSPKGAIELDYFKQQLQNNFNSNKFNQLEKQQQQRHQRQQQHPLKLASPEYLAGNLNKSVEEVFEHPRHGEQGDINYKNKNSNNNNDYNVANLNTNTSNHCRKSKNKNNVLSCASKKKLLNKTDENSNSPPHPENVAAQAKVTAKKLGGHSNLYASGGVGGREINNMGSNVSRQQIKGLSGRRTQSSGDLYNGTATDDPLHPHANSNTNQLNNNNNNRPPKLIPLPKSSFADNLFRRSKRAGSNFKRGIGKNSDDDSNADTSSTISSGNNNSSYNAHNNMQIGGCGGGGVGGYVSRKDRNKFCGSLPNNLDADDVADSVFPNYNPNVFNNYQLTTNNDTVDNVQVPQFPTFDDITYQQLSSCNTSLVSGQESSNSSTNLGHSAFRITNNLGANRNSGNPERRKEISFKLPLNRTNIDTGYDQGYGSERSPEDELPPPLPMMLLQPAALAIQPPDVTVQRNYLDQYWASEKSNFGEYDFITQDCIFFVNVKKGPRGLGLSVSGGSDSNSVFPGLIRIKRLFPHQAAWATGRLLPGDIILDVNGVSLTGLTNYEALEALRTTDNNVTMIVCRPQDESYRKLSPPTEAPKPPQRSTNQHLKQQQPFLLEQLDPSHDNFSGEYEVILTKQQGSLGFTLRKEDESILGHCIRALVREPATTDGRLKPGDKILAVNDVPISSMTHEQAVIFLRQAPEVVKIRFYRDEALTPVSLLSENDPIGSKTNKLLRPEARNLLTDIAHRKQNSCGNSSCSSAKSSNASPRKLRRGTRGSNNTDGNSVPSDSCDFNYPPYAISCDTTYSDSDASTIVSQANSVSVHPISSSNSSVQCQQGYTVCEPRHSDADDYYREDELQQIMDDEGSIYSERLASNRPTFLDLAGPCGSTPTSSTRPRFQFSVANANAYELNNLDNEMLDAPAIYTLCGRDIAEEARTQDQSFISLPCETFLVACKTESDLDNNPSSQTYVFNHKNPLYQSVNVPLKDEPNASTFSQLSNGTSGGGGNLGSEQRDGGSSGRGGKKGGTKSLLKWKGVMFTQDNDEDTSTGDNSDTNQQAGGSQTATPSDDLSASTTTNCTSSTPNTILESSSYSFTTDSEGNKIITVELNKGWNSRLGFSLQYDENSKRTIISAIYEDSVAAKDGRLQVNDQLLMINDEPIEDVPTSDIIDGLRIIRGSICLTVLRRN